VTSSRRRLLLTASAVWALCRTPRTAPFEIIEKKQGATGITTVAPYVTGQWGRGNNRLPELLPGHGVVPDSQKYFVHG